MMCSWKYGVYIACTAIIVLNTLYFTNYPILKDSFRIRPPPKPEPEPLTIIGNPGRLGNQMFVLATLYGIGRLNQRRIALTPSNYQALAPYFDINFPQVNVSIFIPRNIWDLGYWLSPNDSAIPSSTNFLAGDIYPTSYTFFEHVEKDIRRIFRFREPFRKHAEDVLAHVKKIRPWTKVFVCVHVRRGDYLIKEDGGWLRAADGREVDVPYFQAAVRYYQTKYKNITFLGVSDDRMWTRKNLAILGILTLPPSPDPGHDLALLASCNHTIMTYGTYGFWGGFLAGGDVVYFSDFVKPGGKMAKRHVEEKMYPRSWIGISTTPKGFWEHYQNPFTRR